MKPEDIALFDMDGTLADYEGALMRDLATLAAPIEGDAGLAEDHPHVAARMRLVKLQEGWWRNLPRLTDGFFILQEVQKAGFDIHILTKGPMTTHVAWGEKVQWCKQNVPMAQITITQDKGLVYGRILVDDYPPYMERWLEWRPRGLGIMPARHYNKDFSHPNVLRFRGARDVKELRKRLVEAKNRKLRA